MGFLDNSGDIILDAVLTDAGRKLLAKGDGSFKITQFALFDDEIDYGLYDSSHESGSAYYDLEILRSPIFEAFTNNASSGKSRLMTIPRTNLLYLPVMKLNDNRFKRATINSKEVTPVAADVDSYNALRDALFAAGQVGVNIVNGAAEYGTAGLEIDQGLDTTAIAPTNPLDADLKETAYIVELDNRFGSPLSISNANIVEPAPSYIDDDDMASYYFAYGTDSAFVFDNKDKTDSAAQVIAGPRGTYLQFAIRSSLNLQGSDYYFERYGTVVTINSVDFNIIEASVRTIGATTGNSVTVPLTYVKLA